jgi:tetratricopeptide (TPR) repeat protein
LSTFEEFSFDKLYEQALCAQVANQLEMALGLFEKATSLNPTHLESWFYLGDIAQQLDLKETALNAYQTCIDLQPDCIPALINGAQVLMGQDQVKLAGEWLEKARLLTPEDELLKETFGKFHFEQGQYEKAIAVFATLANQNKPAPEMFQNWGMALEAAGKLPEAEVVLKTGLSQFPQNALLHFHLSTVLLAQQKFQEGWAEYDWRFQSGLVPPRPDEFRKHFVAHQVAFSPKQLLKPSPHEFNLIIHEQGYGDTIQFSRMFWWLMENDYLSPEARWVIELPKPLIRLFQHQLFQDQAGAITFIERDTSGEISPLLALIEKLEKQTQKQLNAVYSLMSLPSLLPEPELFHTPKAYLTVPENNINKAQEELRKKELSQKYPHVQHWIGWMPSGSPSNLAGKRRSIPGEVWIPMMQHFLEKHPETGLLWLSPDITPKVLEHVKTTLSPQQVFCPFQESELFQDFLETAQWLKGCKQVITIDTALAHLAGALGIPTIILLPYASDWRWFLPPTNQFVQSAWYPSVQLLRQTEAKEWHSLLEQALGD